MSDKQALIDIVKSWVTLDNQIRALSNKLRELRKEKKAQNEQMIQIMKANEIDNFDLKDGQIRYKKETKREALTQKKLLDILAKHPQLGEEQAKHLNQFVFERRKITEKDIIIRKISDT
jgi:seryl-tRNA synthetase